MRRKILESLRRSANKLPQANFNAIRDADVAPMEKHDYITRQAEEKPRRPMRRLALAAVCMVCLLAVALSGGWYWQYGMVDSVVDIDLNPSYDITLNRQGQILEIKPMNEEAQQVLQGRSYKGWDIEEAVFTLFSDLPQHGFLESGTPTVLVSVSGRNEAQAIQLGERISDAIALSLLGSPAAPTVVTQTFSGASSLRQRAAQYGVSPGKMYMVDALLEKGAPYTEAQLAAMDIDTLLALAQEYRLEGLSDHHYPSYAPSDGSVPPVVSSTPPPASSSAAPPAPGSTGPVPPAPLPQPPAGNSPYDDSPYEDSPYDGGDDADDDSTYENDDD